jgi:EpsI family protein
MLELEQAVPRSFGAWRMAEHQGQGVVNPQTQALLDQLYSQTLSRIYVDEKGYAVMLSVAYGDDQRGGLRAHMPDVCYPAQGFLLLDRSSAEIGTAQGMLPVRRLLTRQGSRQEPLTYWFNFGATALRTDSPLERRLIEIRLGLTGQVPDGILMRVSSIDADVPRAYAQQERFVRDMVEALPPTVRGRMAGVGS